MIKKHTLTTQATLSLCWYVAIIFSLYQKRRTQIVSNSFPGKSNDINSTMADFHQGNCEKIFFSFSYSFVGWYTFSIVRAYPTFYCFWTKKNCLP